MGKVKGPLLSLGASGKIADTLVFMSWKGIQDVRQHVIPANPKTAAQQTQRGYVTDAVAEWHAAGYTATDLAALNRAAGVQAAPMSGYNLLVKKYVACKVDGDAWHRMSNLVVSAVDHESADVSVDAAADKTAKLYHGTSKTVMLTEVAGVFDADHYDFDVSGLSASTTYYFYIVVTAAGFQGYLGIGKFTTTAAP